MPDVIYPALHGRQHCPGGEDPIPCLTGTANAAYLEFEAKTIGDSASTNLTGGTVGQEYVTGTALTVDNTTGRITATQDGIYLVSLNVNFDTNFTGYRSAIVTGNINQQAQNAAWEAQRYRCHRNRRHLRYRDPLREHHGRN